MKQTILLVFFVSLFVPNLMSQSFDLVWETGQVLKTPESVMFDEARNQIYVSNINGKPTDKDGNGFITILGMDGSVKQLKWVTGGMHAPKGMALLDSLLYVTDIDRIHIIDIENAKIIKTVEVEGAKFLNDLAPYTSGNIFVSDMANNHLLTFDGNKAEVWSSDSLLQSPNGLTYHKNILYVGVKNDILRIDPSTKKIKVQVAETGPVDGLIHISGGRFLVSNWKGRVLIAGANEKIVLQNTSDQNIQSADIGYIPDEKIVLIPTFFDNRVVARKLP